jgi:hypothetical protein
MTTTDRFEDRLLTELHRFAADHPEDATPVPAARTPRKTRPAAGAQPSAAGRWAGLAALPVAAGVAVTAAVLALSGPSVPPVNPGQPVTHESARQVTDAVALLGKVALAADETTAAVRDDQFIYLDSRVSWGYGEPVHRRQVWLSVDGSQQGLLVEPGKVSVAGGDEIPLDRNDKPSIGDPTYAYLTHLTTDPKALLALVHDYVHRNDGGNGLDEETFTVIGDIVRENLVPPKLSAALYRAAAMIPGIAVLPDITDAAGRHGVAAAWTDARTGARESWIFDPNTLTYLGERDDNTKTGKVGGTTAVLTRSPVDHIGQPPTAS